MGNGEGSEDMADTKCQNHIIRDYNTHISRFFKETPDTHHAVELERGR